MTAPNLSQPTDPREKKIREAVKEDFYRLYSPGFTTDWAAQRRIRGLEIEIMHFWGLSALLDIYAAAKVKEARIKEVQDCLTACQTRHPMESIDYLEARLAALTKETQR